MAPPQRCEPAAWRLTGHGQDPRDASWRPEVLLEFRPQPQSDNKHCCFYLGLCLQASKKKKDIVIECITAYLYNAKSPHNYEDTIY